MPRAKRNHTAKPAIALHTEDASDGARPGFRIWAFDGPDSIGAITVRQHRWLPDKPFGVEDIYVMRRRQGIGTQLYSAAAQEAFRRGFPFMSDMDRSEEADGFWRKQEREGRAVKKTASLLGDQVTYYLMPLR